MLLEELETALDEILPPGYSIEVNKRGEVVIFTNLKEGEDGEELVVISDDEVDPDFDPDFDPLDVADDEDE
jgi:hypothetical protein